MRHGQGPRNGGVVKMRPTILLDVDGPLTSTFDRFFCEYLQDEGVPAHQKDITHYHFANFARPEIISRVYARMREPGTCLAFEPHEGAKDFVNVLRQWATVIAVTAPLNGSSTWAQEREVWLTDHLDFKVEEIISARDKYHVYGDALVDDKIQNIVAYKKRWPHAEAVLWNAPYNLREDWNPRASDYYDVLGLLNKLRG
jgi:5'(3')-deoxyribonucleotidase